MNPEIIGLIATAIIFISYLPKDVRWIRAINFIGCIVWIIYGVMIGALSVWLMNLLVMIVHIYHLVKNKKH